MKKTITYEYKDKITFHNALKELDNIVSCHFHYEYNAGYIVVEEKEGEERV